jgi:hypothetical protein
MALDHHRNAGNPVALHDLERLADFLIGMHGDGIGNHATFIFFYGFDFGGLLLDGEIAVHDADAAHLRQRDRGARFGNGIHRT